MIQIRLAILDDVPSCVELSKIKELEVADNTYISEDYFKHFVDSDEMFFVAEDSDGVVGYVLGEPLKANLAILMLLAVSDKCRGQGIGKQLVKVFEDKAIEKGLPEVILYAPEFNKGSLEFYRKRGYSLGKPYVNAYKDCRK